LEKGLAEGAKTITDYERIDHVQLSENATPQEYLMKYLNNFFMGIKSAVSASVSLVARDSKGNIIDRR
jgi:hypothetical protein